MNQAQHFCFRLKLALLVTVALLLVITLLRQQPVAADGKDQVSFNRDIRPIFSDTCFRCHGPDKSTRQAGLRLDIREEALKKTKSGIVPIVPGKPDESEIIRRIFSTDKFEMMPPEEAHKELTAAQKETIKRWVAEGAKYEGHWSYQAVQRPAVPEVANKALVRNPIDAFIQARLARENLTPAAEADRRALIRRVTLDLTGLPPTPQEVAAFANDGAPDAYEKLVDRLLASERYAEKQAMHWLDAVRYADTSGFHGDNPLPAWPYRDYVLRAFRDNKPFDQFTREQLAGDLLAGASTEQKIASAYNRMNRTSAEGGLQPKEYLAKYGADRVRTTSAVWLGATMGCAECHDHKFDPLLAKDFYAMKAFFADIKETGLVPDRGRIAFGSKLPLPTVEQKQQQEALSNKLAALNKQLDGRAKELSARRAEWERQTLQAHQAGKLAWQFQRPLPASAKATNGVTLKVYNDEMLTTTQYRMGNLYTEQIKGDGLVVAGGANPDNANYEVMFKPGAGAWTALGVEVVQDESLPANRVGRGADRFVLSEVEAELLTGGAPAGQKLNFVLATTDGAGQHPENHAMNAIDGAPQTGWGMSFTDNRGGFLALRLAESLQTNADVVIRVRLRHESPLRRATIGRFRLALSTAAHSWPDHFAKTNKPLNGLPADVLTALQEPESKRSETQQQAIRAHFRWTAPELQALVVEHARTEAALELLESQIPRVVVTETMTPSTTRILPRGNFLDESGEVVTPAIPVMFGKLDTDGRRATRLDLANWIVAKNNPLTARVFVNRAWRQFFGTGLSKVLDDLGSQGEWPTHPELLDWLASEFVQPAWQRSQATHDWNVKHLVRLIVTSHTYRQASNAPMAERDPDNRLLARQSRFRVEAEVVHDIALAVSGLLVEKFGGPSVKPYQPEGYLATLNFPTRDYAASRGDDLYRRGLYTHWQRSFLHPSLLTFDAPTREECTVNRVNSNTPLQALVLLNDPIYVEAARVFAQNILQQGGATVATRLDWAFTRALGRKPTLPERRVLADLHAQSLQRFGRDPRGAADLINVGDAPLPQNVNATQLAAMTTVARGILNLHETITRN